ncbi:hypothetical protein ACNT2N_24005 [Pseudomonas thivervalensis]|uniref:Uncharacterized protein n=1 Tax=Pseudomonas thivervalensis TaxID=86265 RepID=A0A2Z4ZMR7_9PSED|nr:hypothetical protein [Pseudomonas thivervalensis]AXA52903.1 hypothetical protein CE140_00550 [Pseudomonas thivervalensis]AXA58621.1 hypothetical protein CEQ51_00550 [Pseudomonas thivervalensis]
MDSDEKMSKLIAQVLRATYSGQVRWEVSEAPPSLTRATDSFIPLFLKAIYKGHDLVVYEERGKYWTDEDTFNWSTALHFGVVIGSIVVSDYARYSPVLRELYEEAKKNASNLDSLLDNLLD